MQFLTALSDHILINWYNKNPSSSITAWKTHYLCFLRNCFVFFLRVHNILLMSFICIPIQLKQSEVLCLIAVIKQKKNKKKIGSYVQIPFKSWSVKIVSEKKMSTLRSHRKWVTLKAVVSSLLICISTA